MSEKSIDQTSDAATDEDRRSLKKGVIAFAIIEALVLVPLIIYLLLR